MALLDSLFGQTPSYYGGLLGEDELSRLRQQAQEQGTLNTAMALLQAGAPSRTPGGGALAIAQGLQQGQQAYRQALNQGLQEKMAGLQVQDLMRKRQEEEAVRRFLPQVMQFGAPEQNWETPNQISQYFQTGQIPKQPGPSTINREALQQLALVAPEQFAKLSTSLKALQPEYKEAGGILYEIPTYGGTPTAVGGKPKEDLAGSVKEAVQVLGITKPITEWGDSERAAVANYINTSDARKQIVVNMNEGQKGFENISKLRKDFTSEPVYKEFNDMRAAHSQVISAINANTPIGDTAAATKIMKLLDPGSVVRETELGMAMAATGKMDLLQNYLQNMIDGKKLTPTQRTQFKSLADELYNASAQAYNAKRGEYATIGKEFKLNTDVALGNPAFVMPKSPAVPEFDRALADAARAEQERRRKK